MKSKLSIAMTIIGALAIGTVARAGTKAEGDLPPLTIEQVSDMVAKKTIAVYDVNGDDRYKKGHVPTAKHVSLADLKPTDLSGDKEQAIVFYCGGLKCNACHTGAHKAIEYGYKKVYIMPEGISGWEKAGKPVEKG